MEELLQEIKNSPANFHDLYEFKMETASEPKIHLYPKSYVVKGDTKSHQWIGKAINYLFYPENDGYVDLDVRIEARFVPRQPEHNFTTFDHKLEVHEPKEDSAEPSFEKTTIDLEILRFSKHFDIREYNDEKVFDLFGIEIWKTNWEIPYKEEQIRNFKKSVEREIESVLEY